MLIVLRKSYVFFVLVLVGAILLSAAYFGMAKEQTVDPVENDVIIIDAGHGGMDGGAVGVSGVLEKNINLSIALKLKDIAEKDGKTVIMTRKNDVWLDNSDSNNVRTQKRSDLKNRKKFIENNPNAVFVGIHQNLFEQPKYRGAQVFYADNDDARRLGECMQQALIDGMSDGNTRVAKKAEDIYILKGVTTAAVIAECGFLSNPEEEKLLTQNEYQTKIAQSVYDGICRFKENYD